MSPVAQKRVRDQLLEASGGRKSPREAVPRRRLSFSARYFVSAPRKQRGQEGFMARERIPSGSPFWAQARPHWFGGGAIRRVAEAAVHGVRAAVFVNTGSNGATSACSVRSGSMSRRWGWRVSTGKHRSRPCRPTTITSPARNISIPIWNRSPAVPCCASIFAPRWRCCTWAVAATGRKTGSAT